MKIEKLELKIMIRKLFFLALAGLGLFSCKDDEEIGFDVPVDALSVEECAGAIVKALAR